METEHLNVLIAFGAGVLSVASPCMLPLVPIYLAHLVGVTAVAGAGAPAPRATPLLHALSFVLGFSLVFVLFGVSFGLLGFFIQGYKPILEKVAGVLLIILGLHVARIVVLPFLEVERRVEYRSAHTGYIRSFIVGSAFAVGWVPCVGPILGGILALAATSSTAVQGGVLLTAYSLGLGLPFLAAGIALGPTTGVFRRLSPYLPAVSVASGTLLIAVGVLIFTSNLVLLNKYFDFFGLSAI